MSHELSLSRRMARLVLAISLAVPLLVSAGCGVFGGEASEVTEESVQGGYGIGAVAPPDAVESYDATLDDKATLSAAEPAQRSGVPGSGEDASTVPADQRLIIRTVDMRVKVDDVEESVAAIRKAVDARKGIVTDLQISTQEDVPIYRPYESAPGYDGTALSGYITVRVPAEGLQDFLDEVGELGDVVRESENESDVTQQHVDLSARLKNLQATEARLREFFEKAKNVTEMLAIEQELARVRGDIEAMQAEIAYLERQAALSTVTVELVGPTPVVRPTGEDWGFVDALTQAVRGFVNTVNVLIVLTGALAPVILLGIVAFYVIRTIVRRKRTKKAAGVAASTPTISEEPTPSDGPGADGGTGR